MPPLQTATLTSSAAPTLQGQPQAVAAPSLVALERVGLKPQRQRGALRSCARARRPQDAAAARRPPSSRGRPLRPCSTAPISSDRPAPRDGRLKIKRRHDLVLFSGGQSCSGDVKH